MKNKMTQTVKDFFNHSDQRDKASAKVAEDFKKIWADEKEQQALCTTLTNLKAKAGKKGTESYDTYRRKTQQVQKACSREYILKDLYGDEWQDWTISVKMDKGIFSWIESHDPATVPAEQTEEKGEVQGESVIQPAKSKDLAQVILDYIAKHKDEAGIADDIKQGAEMLTELAQPYYTK